MAIKKRLISLLSVVTLLGSVFAVGSAVSPATADIAFGSNWSASYNFAIGDNVNIDASCTITSPDTVITSNYFNSGSLPPGLTWNNGIISGSPTTVGDYSIGSLGCSYTINGGSYAAGAGPWAVMNFHVSPQQSPTPTLKLVPLNDAQCDFRVLGSIPAATEPGKTSLMFSWPGGGWGPVVLNDPTPNSIFDFTVSALDFTSMTYSQQVSSMPVGVSPNMCNNSISVDLTYNEVSALPATASATVTPTENQILTQTPTPSLTVQALNNATCDVRIVGALPATPDAGSANIILRNPDSYVVIGRLQSFAAGEVIDETFSANDISWSNNADFAASFSTASGQVNWCDQDITVYLAYTTAGLPAATNSAVVHPVQVAAMSTKPVIEVHVLNDAQCSVDMSVFYPSVQAGANPHVYIASADAGYNLQLETPTAGAITHYILPLNDSDAMNSATGVFSAVPWGAVDGCGGQTWTAEVDLNDAAGNGVVSATTSFFATVASAPAVACPPGTYSATGTGPCTDAQPGYFVGYTGATSPTICPLGYYTPETASFNCTPAPLGSYVATTGATAATQCPTGLSTALTASRSLRECFKLNAQTVSLKLAKKYKVKAKFVTPLKSNQGASVTVTAAGACAAKVVTQTTKVKGKKTTSQVWQVTAAAKPGTCTLTFSNAGDYYNAPLNLVKTFKVSKTGK